MALTVEGIRSSAQLVGNEVACMLSLLKSFFVARVQGGKMGKTRESIQHLRLRSTTSLGSATAATWLGFGIAAF